MSIKRDRIARNLLGSEKGENPNYPYNLEKRHEIEVNNHLRKNGIPAIVSLDKNGNLKGYHRGIEVPDKDSKVDTGKSYKKLQNAVEELGLHLAGSGGDKKEWWGDGNFYITNQGW